MILEIARIQYCIAGTDQSSYTPSAAFQPFLKVRSWNPVHKADVTILLQKGLPVFPSGMITLLENDRSEWLIARDRDAYYFTRNPFHPDASWLARTTMDFSKVEFSFEEPLQASSEMSASWLEFIGTQFSYPLLMHVLSRRAGALFHAAAVDVHGKGCLFPGKSETGKSTLARQFLRCQCGRLLGDEQIVVRKLDGAWYAFGTPWPGESGVIANSSVPLTAIFCIVHDRQNFIVDMDFWRAFEWIINTIAIPWYDQEAVTPMLAFYEELLRTVPVYELHCTPTVDVVDVVERHVVQL